MAGNGSHHMEVGSSAPHSLSLYLHPYLSLCLLLALLEPNDQRNPDGAHPIPHHHYQRIHHQPLQDGSIWCFLQG
jgi:hypothetical protein